MFETREHLVSSLETFEASGVRRREEWYGRTVKDLNGGQV